MALLGSAAMVLCFDIDPAAWAEHDDWHTHEHMPERLSIPGFLRGSRWVATQGGPRYLVLYEVAEIGVLTSRAYLERLNHPTPWTQKMMQSYRGMSRGLCSVRASFGRGLGTSAVLLRSSSEVQGLAELVTASGMASAALLRSAVAAPMTKEQEMRGRDDAMDWVALVTGYAADAVQSLARTALSAPESAAYRLEYFLT
jgi:hypothetical protein